MAGLLDSEIFILQKPPINRVKIFGKIAKILILHGINIAMSEEISAESMQHTAQVQGLFVKHSSQIRGLLISLLPGNVEVDDLLQETFLTITAKASNFEIGTNFVAWSMTIARFKVKEHFRKSQKAELLLGDDIMESLIDEAPEVVADDSQIRALKKCLQNLSPSVQKMLSQRYEDGMKPEKIAQDVGWGASSVYVALSRARSTLRACIQKQITRSLTSA